MAAPDVPAASRRLRLGILASHPIQYQAPLFRELAGRCDLQVYYAQMQTPRAQAEAGFGVEFSWDVDLLSGYASVVLENVAQRPDTGAFFGCDTPGIAKEIESRNFDAFLVMGWHLKCFWQAVRACHASRTPVMVRGDSQLATQRSLSKRAIKAAVYPWLLRQFDAALYVGERNRDYLQRYGVQPRRLFPSPHCVDTKAFAMAASRTDRNGIRASWGLPETDHAILFAGRMLALKRVADVVQAAAALTRQGRAVTIICVGEGPERTDLEMLGRALQVPMRFLGFRNQSELPSIYRAADVLVLPSESETWGLVVNEAMACGTPCVVADTCGCVPDMILPGATGQSYPMGDVEALTRALDAVLAGNVSTESINAVSEAHSVASAADGVLQATIALAGTGASARIRA
jgi:glycosyltransferase involved in cell wall biosynthesis